MSTASTIEWTDATWNPVRGCALVSEGCRNCYAMKQAHRFSGPGKAYEGLTELGPNGPRWNGRARPVPEMLA
jgi:protein gp37